MIFSALTAGRAKRLKTGCVSEREAKIGKYQKDGWRVTYVAKVRVVAGGVLKEGTGAGHGIDVDLGQAHESAVKEAESDAMKRALMLFGDQFGLALYDKAKAHVGIDHEPEAQKPAPQSITPQQEAALSDLFKNLGENGERMKHQLLEKQRIEKLGDLSARLFEDVHSRLMKVQKPQGGADAA